MLPPVGASSLQAWQAALGLLICPQQACKLTTALYRAQACLHRGGSHRDGAKQPTRGAGRRWKTGTPSGPACLSCPAGHTSLCVSLPVYVTEPPPESQARRTQVFDGHAGSAAAEFAAEHLLATVLSQPDFAGSPEAAVVRI